MTSGKPLDTILNKEQFIQLYKKNGSIEGVSRKTGFDPGSLRKFMKRHNIPLKYKCIYNHDDNAFSIATEHSYYWAGFIAADGCIKNKNKTTKILSISLAKKDRGHIVKFKKFIKGDEPIYDYDTHSSIHIVSRKIAQDLECFNIVPRKSLIYKFPNIEPKYISHFMRGYFDGDGGLHKNKKNQLSISVRGTKDFLTIFREKLHESCKTNHVKISLSNNIHQLCFCGNGNAKKIMPFLYKKSNIYLDRKYEIAKLYW